MPGRLRPMLAVSFAACGPHADWAEVREACRLSDVPDDLHAALDENDPIGRDMSISEQCAAALARSHGTRPSSLDLGDGPIDEPAAIGEVVVTALFDLAAVDLGTTADLIAIDGIADPVVDALAAFDETDAAAALFQYSVDAIKRISLIDTDEAGIFTRNGHVFVATEFVDMPPIHMAGSFVHEAAHRFDVPSHVECYQSETGYPFCDPDHAAPTGSRPR